MTDQAEPTASGVGLAATFETIAASRGYISNLMHALAPAPDGLDRFVTFGTYCRYGTALSERQRELAIVVTLRDVHYGRAHHAPLARALGVTEEQLGLIRLGRTPRDLPPQERALCDYVFEVTACRRIPPRVQEEMAQYFQPRQIVDIAMLSAYYLAAAALTIALDVELEPPEVLAHEQAWQQARIAASVVELPADPPIEPD